MNSIPRRALVLFGCACLASAAAMSAQPEHAPPPPGRMMGEHGPRGMLLDEAQQDKVFAIVHAQEPQMREQAKAARHAHAALHAMAATGQFDEAKASALAQALGKAEASLALLRARTDAQVNALLTPEQRRQNAEHGPRGEQRPDPRPDQRPEPRQ